MAGWQVTAVGVAPSAEAENILLQGLRALLSNPAFGAEGSVFIGAHVGNLEAHLAPEAPGDKAAAAASGILSALADVPDLEVPAAAAAAAGTSAAGSGSGAPYGRDVNGWARPAPDPAAGIWGTGVPELRDPDELAEAPGTL